MARTARQGLTELYAALDHELESLFAEAPINVEVVYRDGGSYSLEKAYAVKKVLLTAAHLDKLTIPNGVDLSE